MKRAMRHLPVLDLLVVNLLIFCGAAAAHGDDPAASAQRELNRPFFTEVVKGTGEYKAQSAFSLPEKFFMPKPAGIKRVFILGGSVAQILGQGNSVLYVDKSGRRILRQPGANGKDNSVLEIINCGTADRENSNIYGVFKEVLRYGPDLLVVIDSDHEVRDGQQSSGFDSKLDRAEFRLLELYYSLKHGSRLAGRAASVKIRGKMLSKIAWEAKKAGVPALFCTLPSNVRDMPSLMSPPSGNARFVSGYRLFYEKKYQAALEEFMAGLSALPRNSLLDFYVAKTLEKLGRNEEAKGFFVKALDHDAYDQRAGDERNAMLKRVAASGGACVADLEGLFHKISYGGLPGFGEFTDAVHWRPSYNNAVWAELSRSAAACGIKGFGRFSAMNSGEWSETARRDAAKRLTYAVSWMGEKNINEASLAELLYVGEKLPGLLEQAAVSPGNIYKLIIRDLWPAGTAARLKTVFPFFLEHLAEHDRRVGKFDAALSLIQRAISLKPGDGYLRLEQAQVLAELGRMGEAGSEFLSLTKEHGVPEAEAFAFAYGFSASPQAQAVSPDKNGDKRLAPALSPLKTRSNDLIDLCFSAAKEKGKKEKALQACQGVVYLISSGEMPARPGSEMLGSNVSFQSCKLLAALGRMEEAQEVLLWTVDNAPASWPWLGEAQKAVRDPGYLLQAR